VQPRCVGSAVVTTALCKAHQSIDALSQTDDCHLLSSCRPCRRQPGVEYVLDYVLERKRVDDMAGSIKSRRYDRQKFNMNMCGLRHLVYLVEGNPDTLGNESGRHHTPSVSDTACPAPQHSRLHASATCMLYQPNALLSCISWHKENICMTCHAMGTIHRANLASLSRSVMLGGFYTTESSGKFGHKS